MQRRQYHNTRTPASAAIAAFLLTALLPTEPLKAQAADDDDGSGDPFAHLPLTLTLTGVVRDFRDSHADFERQPSGGFGHYQGMVGDFLDSEGKPVFASTGRRTTTQWRDAQGNPMIRPRPHLDPRPGDQAGSISTATGALTTAANFSQWFRDVPTINTSAPLSITLERAPGSPLYVFDDNSFFPIDNELYGNQGRSHNYHFSYELSMNFVYKQGANQIFTFDGDDDVWVFIDDRLVIDIGGVHSEVRQTIDLDRCNWLRHNQAYTLRFFFAERHTTESNFRIETTLSLLPAELPTVTALFD